MAAALFLADQFHAVAHPFVGLAVFPANAVDFVVVVVDEREHRCVHVLVLLGIQIRAAGKFEVEPASTGKFALAVIRGWLPRMQ